MPITVAQYTTEGLNGTGVFDVMMRAAKSHLVEEYTQGRITGPEYANVYLSMIEQVMGQAMTYLLNKDKADQEKLLIEAQIRKVDADILLTQTEQDKIQADILRITEEVQLVIAQKCLAQAQFDVAMANIPKVGAETDLLAQKKVTETAQVSSVGVDPQSVIGRQNNLYTQQAQGFIRDAEQKAAKIAIDTWNVRRTTDSEGTDPLGAGLSDSVIALFVQKLRQGVGVL